MDPSSIGFLILLSFLIPSLSSTSASCSSVTQKDQITLTKTSGNFSSPGYPRYYQGAIQCQWLVTVDEGHVVNLAFETFNVGRSGGCFPGQRLAASYVELRDGRNNRSRSLGIFCGSRIPREMSSAGNHMWIRYNANGYRSTKFKAHYKAVQQSSVVQVVVLAILTVGGTVLCVCITVAVVKRRQGPRAEENPQPLSHNQNGDAPHTTDISPLQTCTLEQLPAVLLGGTGETLEQTLICTEIEDEEHRVDCNTREEHNGGLAHTSWLVRETRPQSVSRTINKVEMHSSLRQTFCGGVRGCNYNVSSTPTAHHNLAITDVDSDNEDDYGIGVRGGLRLPPVEDSARRASDSGSVLTSSRVEVHGITRGSTSSSGTNTQ